MKASFLYIALALAVPAVAKDLDPRPWVQFLERQEREISEYQARVVEEERKQMEARKQEQKSRDVCDQKHLC